VTFIRPIVACVVLMTWLAAAPPAQAQSAPRPIAQAIISSTSPLNSEQRAEVKAWIEHHVARLASDQDPAAVDDARTQLKKPLQDLLLTPVFRGVYSGELQPRLAEIIRSGPVHNAINAMQVAGSIGTKAAAELLLKHLDSRQEPREMIRYWAARGLAIAAHQRELSGGLPQQIARDIAAATQSETAPTVLLAQLSALQDIAAALPEAAARDRMIESILAVLGRIARSNELDGLMEPIHSALARLRNAVLNLQLEERKDVAPRIGRCLAGVLEVASVRWDAVQADARAKAIYGDSIFTAEQFLRLIHKDFLNLSGTPQVDARTAWDTGDKATFAAAAQAWTAAFKPVR
jgi:hypothetical protein